MRALIFLFAFPLLAQSTATPPTGPTHTAPPGLSAGSAGSMFQSLSTDNDIDGRDIYTVANGSCYDGNILHCLRGNNAGGFIFEDEAGADVLELQTDGDLFITGIIDGPGGTWSMSGALAWNVTNAVNAFSIDGNLFSLDALNNRLGFLDSSPDHMFDIEAGSLASTIHAVEITGSFATAAATQIGVNETFTTNGSSGSGYNAIGHYTTLAAGYTGTQSTYSGVFFNDVAGTGSTPLVGQLANYGALGAAFGNAATGVNVGFAGEAQDGLRNFGFFGRAYGSGTTNIGGGTFAFDTGGATQIGLLSVLIDAAAATDSNRYNSTSTAILASNGVKALPIFIAQDATGSIRDVFTVGDEGLVGIVDGTAGAPAVSFISAATDGLAHDPESVGAGITAINDGLTVAAFGSTALPQAIIGANDTSGTIGALFWTPRSVGSSIGTLPTCNVSLAGAMVYLDDTNDSKPGTMCYCVSDATDTYAWHGIEYDTVTGGSCPP